MSLFLFTFILIYGGLHAYGLWKLQSAFSLGPRVTVPLLVAAVFLVLTPLLTRVTERAGHEGAAFVLAHIGYPWMGFLFLFFVFSLLLDLGRLIARFFRASGETGTGLFLEGPTPFFLAFGAALLVSLYGILEARNIRVERLSLETGKLPSGTAALRIVQISDVHLGLMVGKSQLERIVRIVRDLEPDLIVSTGDLVDGTLCRLPGLAERLRRLPSPLGKFAVTGNHESYAGLPAALRFTEQAGFRILRGETVRLPGLLSITGVDDPAVGRFGGVPKGAEDTLRPDDDLFTLLLKHRPLVHPASEGRFDLQLSGHTHRGQIFPFTLLTAIAYPYQSGTYSLAGGGLLHVSRGTGTWGPPLRVLSPPEITLIELKKKAAAGGS